MSSEQTGTVASKDGSIAYRGIRSLVARFLRVPLEPAKIPVGAGELLDSFHPAPGWLRLNQILRASILVFLILATSAFAVVLAVVVKAPAYLLLLVVPVCVLLPFTWFALIEIRLRYDCTWYVLTERALRIRRGLIVIQESTITYENIQNVAVRQGPLQRLFGISNITVETAGGGGASTQGGATLAHGGLIEGISQAEELRARIMKQVRSSRSAGLGDEYQEQLELEAGPRVGDGAGWAEITVLLREIRDGLRTVEG